MKKLFSYVMIFIALFTSFLICLGASHQNPVQDNSFPSRDLSIYDDNLDSNWQDWSWNSTVNFSNPSPVQSGSSSISLRYDQAWAGLFLHTDESLFSADYESLRFWIHGGSSGGQHTNVVLYDGSGSAGPSVPVTASADLWEPVEISMVDLGSPVQISGIVLQEANGSAQPEFFLDSMELVSFSGTPGPSPTPGAGPGITIDALSNLHPISPFIYGMSFADEALADELDLPIRRFGGNSTTRYNYLYDCANHSLDWFFENIPEDNAHPEDLPDGSLTDRFIEQDLRTGTQTLLTVPLIGWTPKSRDWNWGFSVAKYGAQQDVDPWRPDAGNGIDLAGNEITENDPTDTSTAIGPSFVQDWMNHLMGNYGSASSGGVQFYNLDNEPMLWNDTHRDVHPDPVSYDELRDRTWLYAAAIKAADPSAKTLGPVAWGWTGYFYSALDWEPGGSWWTNPLDRMAHGNISFVPWYLQQMQDYEELNGSRILDYLDLHCYPQQPGVTLEPAGSPATQALRLRSTRLLWDTEYVDESWIAEPVRLIPRMKEWIADNYPGTLTAVTEYNWGGHEHINGALAQADVLGIFGREGLDLACLWDTPGSSQPCAYAFRMFRNYDGLGGKFGDVSVQAVSDDQSRLSVYASIRDEDGALMIMIINKTSEGLTSAINLTNFNPQESAEVYRYSSADLNAIVNEADQPMSPTGFTATFPANAITLFVIEPYHPSVPATGWVLILILLVLMGLNFLSLNQRNNISATEMP